MSEDVNKKLVKYETDKGEVTLSLGIIRQYLGGSNCSTQELTMFLQLCKYQKLNPFLREAYLIKYGSQDATIVVGKEVFTKRAQKNELFQGYKAGVIIENGKIMYREGSLVLKKETLIGGWAEVYVKGWQVPVREEVSLDEYEGKTKEGKPNRSWGKMPATMIRKVALVHALREAFPEDFQGMYDATEMKIDTDAIPEEEIQQPEEPINVTPEQKEQQGPSFEDEVETIALDLFRDPIFPKEDIEKAKTELKQIFDSQDRTALLAFKENWDQYREQLKAKGNR
jgi:phage recombination protein Bet